MACESFSPSIASSPCVYAAAAAIPGTFDSTARLANATTGTTAPSARFSPPGMTAPFGTILSTRNALSHVEFGAACWSAHRAFPAAGQISPDGPLLRRLALVTAALAQIAPGHRRAPGLSLGQTSADGSWCVCRVRRSSCGCTYGKSVVIGEWNLRSTSRAGAECEGAGPWQTLLRSCKPRSWLCSP